MREEATVREVHPESPPGDRSWLDRLADEVSRLPGSDAAVYVALGIGIYVVEVAVQWIDGSPVATLPPAALAMAVLIPAIPFLVGRYNAAARRTMAAIPPDLLASEEVPYLTERLTSVPARWAWAVGGAAALAVLGRVVIGAGGLTRPIEELLGIVGFSTGPLAVVVVVATLVCLAVLVATFVLKVAYTASWIYRIGRDRLKVDLYGTGALYGFSRLTAAMAISLLGAVALVAVLVPSATRDPLGVGLGLSVMAVAVVVFVLPLSALHGRLVAEKERHLGETVERIRRTRSALHDAVDGRDLPSMDPLQKAISALEIDHRLLAATPTWPWEPETVRWVMGALLFPVLLFTLQHVLGRILA